MHKWLLRVAIGVGLLVAPPALWAQTGPMITSNTIAGTNTINTSIAGPGGQIQPTTVAQLRNATSLKIFASVTGNPVYTATTNDSTLYWVGTAPTTWTITTPAKPFDGEVLTIATDTTLTSMVTLTANTGQSLNSAYSNVTLTAKTSVEFQYSVATTKWYELR